MGKNENDNADYKEGYDSGRSADLMDHIVHDLGRMAESAVTGSAADDSRQKGWEAGVSDSLEHGRK